MSAIHVVPTGGASRRPRRRSQWARLSFRLEPAQAQRLLREFRRDDSLRAFGRVLGDGSVVLVVHCPRRYDAVQSVRRRVETD
ncbi:hypothetical protein [Aeromicrobium massiliense]|uniref:hypothetical protein n=1 Tax=Aeromicrobium massiliense TaxID=1464554 RepID=UPI0003062854|nr:hypothetical protein [Aeromicrobium massiliense]